MFIFFDCLSINILAHIRIDIPAGINMVGKKTVFTSVSRVSSKFFITYILFSKRTEI